jgi:mitotic spindle assembly checkpoint protein MAD1
MNAELLRQAKENSFTLELDKGQQEKATLQQGRASYYNSTHTHLHPELDQHVAKIEELEQTLFELSGEIAGGRHVPPKTRVLCLKENPDQQWVDLRQAAMDRLKSENEALLKRLKDLEDSGVRLGGAEDLVPRESWDQVVREKQDLEGEVKQKEKRLLRLQQVSLLASFIRDAT